MARRGSLDEVRAYYEKILPFYERESVARAHLDFWRDLARRWRPSRILELGSGLGRITQSLACEAPAIGIDISHEMLRRAKKRGSPRSRAIFLAADMRRPVFGCRFDLIVAPSDPFSHLLSMPDRRRALRAVAQQLSAEGRFVLEGLHRPQKGAEPLTRSRRFAYERGALSVSETWSMIGKELWHACYRYRDQPTGPLEQAAEASFLARAWDPRTVRQLFFSCGLAIEECWGDFDRRPFSLKARRLIIVSRPARFVQRRRQRRRK